MNKFITVKDDFNSETIINLSKIQEIYKENISKERFDINIQMIEYNVHLTFKNKIK